MAPLLTKIQKRNQGNKNHIAWTLARKNQCMQYMIMIGSMDKNQIREELDLDNNQPIPVHFDPDQLSTLTKEYFFGLMRCILSRMGGQSAPTIPRSDSR